MGTGWLVAGCWQYVQLRVTVHGRWVVNGREALSLWRSGELDSLALLVLFRWFDDVMPMPWPMELRRGTYLLRCFPHILDVSYPRNFEWVRWEGDSGDVW